MKILVFTIIISLIPKAWAQNPEFIWSESGLSGSQVYISNYKSGQWQAKQTIVNDRNLNILPSIAISDSGKYLAVWSTVGANGSVLKYSFKRKNVWQAPNVLTQSMSTNLAPVIVFDKSNKPWVFWSANNGGDDDIYMSSWSGQSWGQPERVNEPNQVPDILPQAGLDDSGNIWVSWQTFKDTQYVNVTRSIETNKVKKMAKKDSIKMSQVAQLRHQSQQSNIPVPDFFKSRSRAIMYNPADKTNPTRLVKGNLQ